MRRHARQVIIEAPYRIGLQSVPLAEPGPGQVSVESWGSAISAGTELLFFRGQVPDGMAVDTALPGLTGRVTYPLHYGYATVGSVAAVGEGVDEASIGRRVFAFQPHADAFVINNDAVRPIPDGVSWEQALLLPNMETAINLVMDAHPVLGERAVIFGQGVVGLLVLFLLARFPLASLDAVDALTPRRAVAQKWGAHAVYDPAEWEKLAPKNVDLLIEVSSNPAALSAAVRHAPYGARILVGSWYGTKSATLDLGGAFHRNRVSIQSSQVSTIDAAWQARWDKERRFELAWRYLRQLPVEDLISHRIPATAASQAFQLLDQTPDQAIQVILTY